MPTESKSRLPCIILTGPTAVGKSATLEAVAAAVAHTLGRDIEPISADAFQAYRGLDIGTAKPPPEQRHRYHLIDILEPDQQYSAGRFLALAEQACREVLARGALPVIEGGSVFYVQTFLTGMPEAPAASPEVRRQLQQQLDQHGPVFLQQELQQRDPVAAARIPGGDTYRIMRALEICLTSGQPASAFSAPDSVRTGLQPLVLGLQRERAQLYQRINLRVERMFSQGLPAEVRALADAGWSPDSPGLRAIGYREFWDPDNRIATDLTAIKSSIQRNTRRLAKRQTTFLPRIPGISLLPIDDTAAVELSVHGFCEGLDL